MKKFLVLAVLFLLPITVYIFFASGVNNFAKLPVLNKEVSFPQNVKNTEGVEVVLKDKITVLGFFGSDAEIKKAHAFNLAHKIYKKNHEFADFQFVFFITEETKDEAKELLEKISEIADTSRWNFVVAAPSKIETTFQSLGSAYALDSNYANNRVFIIDKNENLRGRTDDEDYGKLYGYDASDYAEINNKMSDDIKVILAEYRLALKKYKADREI